jgi:hypothetical protein
VLSFRGLRFSAPSTPEGEAEMILWARANRIGRAVMEASGALLGDIDAAARLYELMLAYRHMTITAGIVTVCYGAASRYLGMLAAALGEFDKAGAHF